MGFTQKYSPYFTDNPKKKYDPKWVKPKKDPTEMVRNGTKNDLSDFFSLQNSRVQDFKGGHRDRGVDHQRMAPNDRR